MAGYGQGGQGCEPCQPADDDGVLAPGLETGEAEDYPQTALLQPRTVRWKAPDGLEIEGQMFRAAGSAGKQPGLIFVHGGPPRQMLLGWHMMNFYAEMYAMNQWFALHGFTVLSINYRLGIGYGRAFQHAEHAGPAVRRSTRMC